MKSNTSEKSTFKYKRTEILNWKNLRFYPNILIKKIHQITSECRL